MINRIAAAAVVAAALPVACALAGAPALADSRPVPEGEDTQRCVTWAESDVVTTGMTRERVRRVLDTRGHRVPPSELDAALAGFPVDTPTADDRDHREVRQYPTCPEDGVPAVFFVEFNHHTGRAIGILWI